jgi:hypothetical protein
MVRFLKSSAKSFLERLVVPPCRFVVQKTFAHTVIRELETRVAAECADYVQAKMPTALQFERKKDLWDFAIRSAQPEGLFSEFGVFKGGSINHIARRISPRIIYGFDSFAGLREDWAGSDMAQGSFSLDGELPKVRPNVRLVKGWFDKTVPDFLAKNPGPFAFVHVDCDTYEASRAVLGAAGHRIQTGTVLVFDEYFGYRGWRIGEHRAWQEFVRERVIKYEYTGFSEQAVSVRIT